MKSICAVQNPFVPGIYHAGIEVYGEAHQWGCLGEEEVTISCADDLSADHLDPFLLTSGVVLPVF